MFFFQSASASAKKNFDKNFYFFFKLASASALAKKPFQNFFFPVGVGIGKKKFQKKKFQQKIKKIKKKLK